MKQIFKSTKTLLQEIVEQAGHKVIAKQYSRQNCNYSWESLNQIVPDALNSVKLENLLEEATYRLGLPCKAAIYAVKKYHSHRRIPESVLTDIDINI